MSTVMFGRLGKHLSPLVLNAVKGLIAIALITATLLVQGKLEFTLPLPVVGWLLLSGAIGIGLGDTAYFAALNHLGARRVLLLESLAPPMAALLAWGFLSERLSSLAWIGISLTVLGVAWVIAERVPGRGGIVQPGRGIVLGLLAALGQATGAVISRGVLANSDIDPLLSGLLRIGAGLAVLGVLLVRQGQGRQPWVPLRSLQILGLVSVAAFFGTYLAIWLQQIAFKFAPAGIAQALTATSPLFVLPIAIALGDRVSGRAVLGVCAALGGVWVLIAYGAG
ncbi:MAG: DMT family transporter [Leptolyngbyaceae cyanobacterium T60_A2020_046]|nr:DMT family transporter [Leptolyngbyaceae cyanobacterium T60_A2020_046]